MTQAVLTDGTHYLIYISTPLLHDYWLDPYKAGTKMIGIIKIKPLLIHNDSWGWTGTVQTEFL